MGEFYCALKTNGTLSHETNQHGFDVIANNKRISVKTTAQESGFLSISKNALDLVDELMVIRYKDSDFHILYHGDIKPAIEAARVWQDKYERDISKARTL